MPINLLFDLANYTPADASPVQANLQQIEQYLNQEVITRDGLVAMTAALRLFNSTPLNDLDAASKGYIDALVNMWRPHGSTVATSQSTSSAVFTDLATVGPVVTLETGTLVRLTLAGTLSVTAPLDGKTALMSVAISGATTTAAGTAFVPSLLWNDSIATYVPDSRIVAVNAGTNVFTAKYMLQTSSGGTATFSGRHLVVERLN